MPIKQGELYELPEGRDEQLKASQKLGIPISSFATDNEFHSDFITVNGKRGKDLTVAQNKAGEKIEGLRCPDCNAQAFKTDQKWVAVCGDYPGWYFFFRRTDLDVSSKAKISIKIINGVPTYVDESGQAVNKNE